MRYPALFVLLAMSAAALAATEPQPLPWKHVFAPPGKITVTNTAETAQDSLIFTGQDVWIYSLDKQGNVCSCLIVPMRALETIEWTPECRGASVVFYTMTILVDRAGSQD